MKRQLTKVYAGSEQLSHRVKKGNYSSKEDIKIRKFVGDIPDCPISTLALDRVLPGGQAFRWRKLPSDSDKSAYIWRGVIGKLLFDLSQHENIIKVCAHSGLVKNAEVHITEILKRYFNLEVGYAHLLKEWTLKDHNFKCGDLDTNGARVLAVDPTEALFSFICSSNNNIPRISKMVNSLAELYGEKICTVDGVDYFAFPKPSDLTGDDVEKRLRAAGFGYRAGYIAKAAKKLEELGGAQWLESLKSDTVTYSAAAEELLQLPGVGRKVADCVCLIGLGKSEAVPIDTHVFQVANNLYNIPCLSTFKENKSNSKSKKALSAKMYQEIGDFFRCLWGSYAGWAQQILFTQRVLNRKG